MAEAKEKLEQKLNQLVLKKEYLFSKLQRTYDLSLKITVSKVDSCQLYLLQCSELDNQRKEFEKIVMDIMLIEKQILEKPDTTMKLLDSYDELYFACKLVAANCEKIRDVSDKSASCSRECNLIRPSLPKLTLYEFHGQIEQWPTFYDTFLSLVHNRDFNNIDKFHYLLSCVKGPALNIVKSLPITAANYHVVWQNLIDKYQNNRILTSKYLDKMLTFTPLTKDTVDNLTSFVETFDNSLKAIRSLNINNLDDYLFCHIALRGLDNHTRKLFEESRDQNELPTFTELMNFIHKQIKVLENVSSSCAMSGTDNYSQKAKFHQNMVLKHNNNIQNQKYNKSSKSVLASLNQPNNSYNSNKNKNLKFTNNKNCAHCNLEHMIYRCEQFRLLSIHDRIARIKTLKLCFNCLKPGHDTSTCKSTLSCGVCAAPHHYLLHIGQGESAVPTKQLTSDSKQALVASHCSGSVSAEQCSLSSVTTGAYGVVLGTTRTLVSDITGQLQDCRAVIDSGAQSSFITLDCAQRLGLYRKKCPFDVSGLSGKMVKTYGMVTCTIKSRESNVSEYVVDMVVVPRVSSEMPNVSFSEEIIKQYKIFNLADPLFYKKSKVDILLGNDIVSELIIDKPVIINPNIPSIIKTVFGYVVSGKLYCCDNNDIHSKNFYLSIENHSLDKCLRDFWEIEELPCSRQLNPNDQFAENIFMNEYRRDVTGRYSVPLPLAAERPPLGESRAVAERRLMHIERKLARLPDLQKVYNEFMREYEALGHMELYTGDAPSKYLIPHHYICRPDSTSTPLRVVFDASAKTTNNISLNNILLTGNNLYLDISTIILNFRLFEYCFTSDICKMYRAILVNPEYRKYQHILFRASPSEPIKTYELKTVTYGLSCSPFLAIRTLHQLANDEGERYQAGREVIRSGIYMDDILWSCSSFKEACRVQDEIISLLKSGGFILKKWASNKPEILARVPDQHRECPITFRKEDTDISLKILGLKWTPSSDSFYFSVDKNDNVTTKRSVLRILASIFDPVGFLAPCTFLAKCIMQDLWRLGVGWDDPIPSDVQKSWLRLVAELPCLSQLHIERHMLAPEQEECELIGFCDGSSRGYGACIYIRSKREGRVKVRLVTAKSKVAPVKPITIPRLELMAAVLLSKLIKFVITALKRIKINNISAFTDSTVVLSWLQTDAYKLKTFVCNRVTQIIEILPSHLWRHVISEHNPADVCSRGVLPSQFIRISQQWLEGPSWLYDHIANWPVRSVCIKNDMDLPEKKRIHDSFNLMSQNYPNQSLIVETKLEFCERIIARFSSYSKLQRTIARILNLKNMNLKKGNFQILTTTQLKQAHDCLIQLIQSAYFENEIESLKSGNKFIKSLRKLSPFLDKEGFLRVGGRISHSELTYNAKHPLLLPKGSYFTRLLIEYSHKKYLHAGPRALHNILIQTYWILAARNVIRSVLSKCKQCFKCKPTLLQPVMGDLPAARLVPNKVFDNVGVDIGGPFLIKESLRRNAKIGKAYLCLFVCFSTKAVHLEVLSSLSTDCFLATLDRFTARRGLCSCLYSDCGTNFVAANKYLTEVQNFLKNDSNQNQIYEGCSERQIKWHFNPPSAPHMGGIWEIGIKAAKYHMVRSIGNKALTFEELSTLFCKIEAVMNSRPLCALPANDEPHEFNVLTPGHFLVGKQLTAVPEYNIEPQLTYTNRWRYVQAANQLFWRKWKNDYLNTLQQRAKWFTSSPNLKIGDLVLVKTDHTASINWPLAKVVSLHPGSDGVVRCVTLRTQKSTFQRPVHKLSPLPYVN